MSTTDNFTAPESLTITGILKDVTHLTPDEHGVKKELVILTIGDAYGGIKDVVGSPKYLAKQFKVEEKELDQVLSGMLRTVVEFRCEKKIAGVTGYLDKDKKVRLHEADGYSIRNSFSVSEQEAERITKAASLRHVSQLLSEEQVQDLLTV